MSLELNLRFIDEKPELIALCSIPGITRRELRNLISMYGSPAGAWRAVTGGVRNGANSLFERELAEYVVEKDPIKIAERYDSMGVGSVVLGEDRYPAMLKETSDPPLALFFFGELPLPDEPCVAVVGTRSPTPQGMEIARMLSRDLSSQGVVVVSGAALGIDSAAHEGALGARGKTAAVLGCGPDIAYPARNRRLLREIKMCGSVISEYPPGVPPMKHRFPERNRIIAGVSLGVVVVEAARESGALITASFAISENREVFAVPGSVLSSKSEGTNDLIKSGAVPVTCVNDVLDCLSLQRRRGAPERTWENSLSSEEKTVMGALRDGLSFPEEISASTSICLRDVLRILSVLEVKERVSRVPGGGYFERLSPDC